MDIKAFVSRLHDDDGQVWSYVLNIILVAVVIGAIITQFGPIIWNHISIHGTADDAAQEAAVAYQDSRGDMDRVNAVVLELLNDREARLDGTISVIKGQNRETDVITVPVRKIVNTFLFENVGYLCKYTEAKAFSEYTLP